MYMHDVIIVYENENETEQFQFAVACAIFVLCAVFRLGYLSQCNEHHADAGDICILKTTKLRGNRW